MWTAAISSLSEIPARTYNYFNRTLPYDFIGNESTMRELVDFIRNHDDGYDEEHLEDATDNEYGIRYYLTIRSLFFGCRIEFELYDLDNLEGCSEVAKEGLLEVKLAAIRDRQNILRREIESREKNIERLDKQYSDVEAEWNRLRTV